jgi:hypothetical protein
MQHVLAAKVRADDSILSELYADQFSDISSDESTEQKPIPCYFFIYFACTIQRIGPKTWS